MKKVVTAEQMGEIDRLTTVEFDVPSIDLMENAAKAVFGVIVDELGGNVAGKKCVVLCGTGNNGGDGAAVARLLAGAGAHVEAYLLGHVEDTSGDARTNFERYLNEAGSDRTGFEVETRDDISRAWNKIRSQERFVDVIVDAVFGTGLHRPVVGVHEYFLGSAMDYCIENAMSPPLLLSVDLPSGIDSDKAVPIGFNFNPDVTVTFTCPKKANVLPPVSTEQGRLFIREIGSPPELIDRAVSQLYLAEEKDPLDWMASTGFTSDSYKKRRGAVLVAAGSAKYPGAAVLAANGAMRSGAGIVTAAVPEAAYRSVSERVLPEVMVKEVAGTDRGSFGEADYQEISSLVATADSILVGCGISTDSEAGKFVEAVLDNRETPVVVDADGLNAISPFKGPGTSELPLILTPHEGEFRRLLGVRAAIGPEERAETLRRFAVEHQVICVLKGERTLCASPTGDVVINPSGNPGLGKAGNGDNLAGIIAGFVAQTMASSDVSVGEAALAAIFRAVVSAVYVAGLAGDIAAERFGKRVMTASDVRDCLSAAFAGIAGSDVSNPAN